MKAETLKKPCVKFEERRLYTLRENRICQKVNQNVNQERAVRPAITNLITGFFLPKTRLKKGFAGVYIVFLISAQYLDCGYSLVAMLQSLGGAAQQYAQNDKQT